METRRGGEVLSYRRVEMMMVGQTVEKLFTRLSSSFSSLLKKHLARKCFFISPYPISLMFLAELGRLTKSQATTT